MLRRLAKRFGGETRAEELAKMQAVWRAVDLGQGILEFDLQGVILKANDEALRIFGYGRDEIVGKHQSNLCPDGYMEMPENKQIWQEILLGRCDTTTVLRKKKSGHEIWLSACYSAVLDKQGSSISVVSFFTDVTEWKERVAESEGLAHAVDQTHGTLEFDLDGTILRASPRFLETYGYELSEIVGKNHTLFHDAAYTSSQEYKALFEKLRRGENEEGVYRRLGKDHKVKWSRTSYSHVFNASGKHISVLAMTVDITEAKNRTLASQNKAVAIDRAMGSMEFSLDGHVLGANLNMLNMLGYDLDEIVGKHHRTLCDPEFVRSTDYQKFWLMLNRGEFDSGRYKRIDKGGNEIWLQGTYSPIFGFDGKLRKIVKIATDITTQINTENRIRDYSVEMADAVEELFDSLSLCAENSMSLADETRRFAQDGTTAMEKSIETMRDIEQSNDAINDFIHDIESIAAKTNLLALNATIEASRAAEHGKGFAVVAQEVNILASRSTVAAAQIIKAMEGTVRHVRAGSEVSGRAAEVFGRIVASVSTATSEIARANENASEKSHLALKASIGIRKILSGRT